MAKTFDGPPSIERSGSEHREGAVTSSRPLGFLSPRTGGTEGGVKTIEEGLGEKVELSLQERRRGRKTFEKGHWDSRIYFINFA